MPYQWLYQKTWYNGTLFVKWKKNDFVVRMWNYRLLLLKKLYLFIYYNLYYIIIVLREKSDVINEFIDFYILSIIGPC